MEQLTPNFCIFVYEIFSTLNKRNMSTQIYSIPLSFNEILKLVKSLTIEDKIRIEEEIEKETLLYRAKKLDGKIPDNSIVMDEIIDEVNTYRKSNDDKK
jgi:hypothetical protein